MSAAVYIGGVSLLTGVSNEHGDVRRDSQILVRTPGEAIMNKPMTYAEKNKTSQTKSLKVKTNINLKAGSFSWGEVHQGG